MSGVERKRRASFGQWLLLVALLFGIATMHTVGHPAEHASPGPSAAAAHGEHEAPPPAAASAAASSAVDSAPMSGMDPMTVCLAVLSTWGVALLVLRLLGPRRARLLPGRAAGVRAPLLPWPNPPPRKTVLATLSVLRI